LFVDVDAKRSVVSSQCTPVNILKSTFSRTLPYVTFCVTFGLWHEPSVCRLLSVTLLHPKQRRTFRQCFCTA